MTTLRDLNRYLTLEAFVRSRPETDKHRLLKRADDVEIDGHEVSVTEDEEGVVELYEE